MHRKLNNLCWVGVRKEKKERSPGIAMKHIFVCYYSTKVSQNSESTTNNTTVIPYLKDISKIRFEGLTIWESAGTRAQVL